MNQSQEFEATPVEAPFVPQTKDSEQYVPHPPCNGYIYIKVHDPAPNYYNSNKYVVKYALE